MASKSSTGASRWPRPGICQASTARVSSTASREWRSRGASWRGSPGTSISASRVRGISAEMPGDGRGDGVSVDVPDYHHRQIVRHIARLVIPVEIRVGDRRTRRGGR